MEALALLGHRPQLTAINHWDVAIATHTANHPDARHLCTSLDNINPRDLYRPGELKLLWASPECTHHSVARGGAPINDQSRATAWCVVRWAEALRPPVILVENVPEFETWGAIGADGRPLKSKRGATFLAWAEALRSLGYRVDWRVLCAADYGDPTTRRRLFVQAVRGQRKIVWPDATHAPADAGQAELFAHGRKPWVPARDIIDWTQPGQSIYERKRPLSDKTLRRIWAGLEKFGLKPFLTPGNGERVNQAPRTHGIEAPIPTVTAQGHLHLAEPFIIAMEHGGHVRDIGRPLNTVTTAKGGAHAVAQPFLIEMRGTSEQQVENTSRSVDRPMGTVTAGGVHHGVCSPFLVQVAHGNGKDANGDSRRVKSLEEPMPTVCGQRGDMALIEPSLLPQQSDGILRPVSQPAPTIATAGAVALVEPYLVEYYGNGRAQSVNDPLGTVTTKSRFGLARPVVVLQGQRYLLDIRFRMLQPRELAAAQGFRDDYQFSGTKTEQVKQIGNAVPRNLARAIVLAAVGQTNDITRLLEKEEAA